MSEELISQDPTSGKWRKKIGTDGHHEIFRWLSDAETLVHLESLRPPVSRGEEPVSEGVAESAETHPLFTALQEQMEEIQTLLASHGVKVVETTEGAKLVRIVDHSVIEPPPDPNRVDPQGADVA
jgi:hypothetical protein